MLLSDKEIHDLITNINDEIEYFDANAHEYNDFVKRITEAATSHEKARLRYVNNYGLVTDITINGKFASILVEEELPFEEIFDIPEFKALHPKIKDALEADIIDCRLECDELQEHRALFNYELVVPTTVDFIFDAYEKIVEYVNYLKYNELHKLQGIIEESILEHSWIEGDK